MPIYEYKCKECGGGARSPLALMMALAKDETIPM
jgi:predicted nucleic acid-binding Zn ribbon protein